MRWHLAGSVILGLLAVSFGSADLETERVREREQVIPAGMTKGQVETFKANRLAVVGVSGEGKTCLGLYVFDEHGNCVARDDFTSPQASDDLVATWVPAARGRYVVEVRNQGNDLNSFELAIP